MAHRFSEFYPDIGHYEDGDDSFFEVLFAVGFDTFEEADRFQFLLSQSTEFNELVGRIAMKAVRFEEEEA